VKGNGGRKQVSRTVKGRGRGGGESRRAGIVYIVNKKRGGIDTETQTSKSTVPQTVVGKTWEKRGKKKEYVKPHTGTHRGGAYPLDMKRSKRKRGYLLSQVGGEKASWGERRASDPGR